MWSKAQTTGSQWRPRTAPGTRCCIRWTRLSRMTVAIAGSTSAGTTRMLMGGSIGPRPSWRRSTRRRRRRCFSSTSSICRSSVPDFGDLVKLTLLLACSLRRAAGSTRLLRRMVGMSKPSSTKGIADMFNTILPSQRAWRLVHYAWSLLRSLCKYCTNSSRRLRLRRSQA